MISTSAALWGLSGLLTVAGLITARLAQKKGDVVVTDAGTRLVVGSARRNSAPQLWLEREGEVVFGPVRADWRSDPRVAIAAGNPTRDPRQPGGDAAAGNYEVTAVVDLSDEPEVTRHAMGDIAIVLRPRGEAQSGNRAKGHRDLAIHGGQHAMGDGAAGGIRIDDTDLRELCAAIGEAKGLWAVVQRG